MKDKSKNWQLTDHICRECQGRILVASGGATGGGGPLWMCADCERAGAAMSPDHLCGCGMYFKNSEPGKWMCLRFPDFRSDQAWLVDVFAHCGYDVLSVNRRGVIGIVNIAYYGEKERKNLEERKS